MLLFIAQTAVPAAAVAATHNSLSLTDIVTIIAGSVAIVSALIAGIVYPLLASKFATKDEVSRGLKELGEQLLKAVNLLTEAVNKTNDRLVNVGTDIAVLKDREATRREKDNKEASTGH
jgi:hypothetical protein